MCVADRCTAAGVNSLTLQTRNASSSGGVGKVTNYLFSSSPLLCFLPLSLSLSSFLYLSLTHTCFLGNRSYHTHSDLEKKWKIPIGFTSLRTHRQTGRGSRRDCDKYLLQRRTGYTVTYSSLSQPANLVTPQEARADLYDH